MNQKKAKALRKQLNLKLPIEADPRIAKKVKKKVYVTNKLGLPMLQEVERIVIVNAAKYQYRQLKKMLNKGAF